MAPISNRYASATSMQAGTTLRITPRNSAPLPHTARNAESASRGSVPEATNSLAQISRLLKATHAVVYGTLSGSGSGESAKDDSASQSEDRAVDATQVAAATVPAGSALPTSLFSPLSGSGSGATDGAEGGSGSGDGGGEGGGNVGEQGSQAAASDVEASSESLITCRQGRARVQQYLDALEAGRTNVVIPLIVDYTSSDVAVEAETAIAAANYFAYTQDYAVVSLSALALSSRYGAGYSAALSDAISAAARAPLRCGEKGVVLVVDTSSLEHLQDEALAVCYLHPAVNVVVSAAAERTASTWVRLAEGAAANSEEDLLAKPVVPTLIHATSNEVYTPSFERSRATAPCALVRPAITVRKEVAHLINFVNRNDDGVVKYVVMYDESGNNRSFAEESRLYAQSTGEAGLLDLYEIDTRGDVEQQLREIYIRYTGGFGGLFGTGEPRRDIVFISAMKESVVLRSNLLGVKTYGTTLIIRDCAYSSTLEDPLSDLGLFGDISNVLFLQATGELTPSNEFRVRFLRDLLYKVGTGYRNVGCALCYDSLQMAARCAETVYGRAALRSLLTGSTGSVPPGTGSTVAAPSDGASPAVDIFNLSTLLRQQIRATLASTQGVTGQIMLGSSLDRANGDTVIAAYGSIDGMAYAWGEIDISSDQDGKSTYRSVDIVSLNSLLSPVTGFTNTEPIDSAGRFSYLVTSPFTPTLTTVTNLFGLQLDTFEYQGNPSLFSVPSSLDVKQETFEAYLYNLAVDSGTFLISEAAPTLDAGLPADEYHYGFADTPDSETQQVTLLFPRFASTETAARMEYDHVLRAFSTDMMTEYKRHVLLIVRYSSLLSAYGVGTRSPASVRGVVDAASALYAAIKKKYTELRRVNLVLDGEACVLPQLMAGVGADLAQDFVRVTLINSPLCWGGYASAEARRVAAAEEEPGVTLDRRCQQLYDEFLYRFERTSYGLWGEMPDTTVGRASLNVLFNDSASTVWFNKNAAVTTVNKFAQLLRAGARCNRWAREGASRAVAGALEADEERLQSVRTGLDFLIGLFERIRAESEADPSSQLNALYTDPEINLLYDLEFVESYERRPAVVDEVLADLLRDVASGALPATSTLTYAKRANVGTGGAGTSVRIYGTVNIARVRNVSSAASFSAAASGAGGDGGGDAVLATPGTLLSQAAGPGTADMLQLLYLYEPLSKEALVSTPKDKASAQTIDLSVAAADLDKQNETQQAVGFNTAFSFFTAAVAADTGRDAVARTRTIGGASCGDASTQAVLAARTVCSAVGLDPASVPALQETGAKDVAALSARRSPVPRSTGAGGENSIRLGLVERHLALQRRLQELQAMLVRDPDAAPEGMSSDGHQSEARLAARRELQALSKRRLELRAAMRRASTRSRGRQPRVATMPGGGGEAAPSERLGDGTDGDADARQLVAAARAEVPHDVFCWLRAARSLTHEQVSDMLTVVSAMRAAELGVVGEAERAAVSEIMSRATPRFLDLLFTVITVFFDVVVSTISQRVLGTVTQNPFATLSALLATPSVASVLSRVATDAVAPVVARLEVYGTALSALRGTGPESIGELRPAVFFKRLRAEVGPFDPPATSSQTFVPGGPVLVFLDGYLNTLRRFVERDTQIKLLRAATPYANVLYVDVVQYSEPGAVARAVLEQLDALLAPVDAEVPVVIASFSAGSLTAQHLALQMLSRSATQGKGARCAGLYMCAPLSDLLGYVNLIDLFSADTAEGRYESATLLSTCSHLLAFVNEGSGAAMPMLTALAMATAIATFATRTGPEEESVTARVMKALAASSVSATFVNSRNDIVVAAEHARTMQARYSGAEYVVVPDGEEGLDALSHDCTATRTARDALIKLLRGVSGGGGGSGSEGAQQALLDALSTVPWVPSRVFNVGIPDDDYRDRSERLENNLQFDPEFGTASKVAGLFGSVL